MGLIEAIQSNYQIFLVAVGGLVWLVRLEGKVNYSEKELSKLETKHNILDSELVKEMSLIKTALARIEGRLEGLHGKEKD